MSSHSTQSIPYLDAQKVLQVLQPQGRLSLILKGFEPREQQQQMLLNIVEAYNSQRITLIEAGTGTGKTMAYLIPAILWAHKNKERTLISTNTITLQEQLIHKDIPLLTKALGIDCHAVLVKGMHNYLCLRKLEDAQEEALLLSPQEKEEIDRISGWSQTTREGSRSNLPFVPSPANWDRVNAEADACNNNECPHFNRCFFFRARREAADANLLVVNHHLLFADIACRAEADNYKDLAVLPPYHHVIVDEAHHIEDIATEFFADHVSRIEIMRTLARLASEKQGVSNGKIPLLKKKILDCYGRQNAGEVASILSRLNVDLPGLRREVILQLGETFQAFSGFLAQMVSQRGSLEDASPGEKRLRLKAEQLSHLEWTQKVVPLVQNFLSTAKKYFQSLMSLLGDVKAVKNDKLQEQVKGIFLDIEAYSNRFWKNCEILQYFIDQADMTNRVRWIETEQMNTLQNVHLTDSELDVSHHLVHSFFDKFRTVVLCSATMTTNQRFDFIRKRWGLLQDRLPNRLISEYVYDSPFDYARQALLVVPDDIASPSDPRFVSDAAEKIWMSVQASHGNAFILFTSYGMMKACYDILLPRLNDNKFPVFKQGDSHRQTILDQFKITDRSVLFGTDSFWEGVDVVGDALRCVIIVKLPFKVPTEPLIQARTEDILAKGGDPFYDYSVPQAIVKFKQGFGRLIRNKRDRGCIVCLDSRLLNKTYGKLFLNSLPPCQKIFASSCEIKKQMEDFYRKTYFLIKSENGA